MRRGERDRDLERDADLERRWCDRERDLERDRFLDLDRLLDWERERDLGLSYREDKSMVMVKFLQLFIKHKDVTFGIFKSAILGKYHAGTFLNGCNHI